MNADNDRLHEFFKGNQLAWGYWFFPHHFINASPPFHLEILKAINSNKKVVIKAPRGFAKSEIVNFLFTIHGICFKRFRSIVFLQASEEKAIQSLASIKKEFEENEELINAYHMTMPIGTMDKTVFRHPDGHEIQAVAFGREQMGKVRGTKFGAYRPDCIVIDDLEDDEMVKNRELREELHRKFKDAVEPSIDIAADYRIIYIDTLKHYDSQLAKMLSKDKYLDYEKLEFPALYYENGEPKSLWEDRIPVKELLRLQKEDPVTFAKEYQGDPVTGAIRKFDPKDFRRWAVVNDDYVLYNDDGSIVSRGSLRDCKASVGYDLAWEERRRHDYCAFVPCLITPTAEILVDSYVNEKAIKPDRLAEYIFTIDQKYTKMTGKVVMHGFEKGKYEKVCKWYLDQERKKRNKWPVIKDVAWVTDKTERITLPLQPRYANHSIFHRANMGDLETQLLNFPSGQHDDLADALQIAVRLLSDAPDKIEFKAQTKNEKFDRFKAFFMSSNKPKKAVFSLGRKAHRIPAIQSFVIKSP